MKVICQKCNATYAINDAAIPPKGARAQCPRCKHLQSVKRGEGADAVTAPGQPPAGAPPPPAFGAPPPAARPPPGGDPFASLGAPPPPASRAAAPSPQMAAGSDPFANFDMPTSPSRAPLGNAFGDLGAAPAPRAAPAPARAAAPAPSADPFDTLDLGGPPPSAAPPPPARSATDPFAHLDLNSRPSMPAAPPPPAAAPAGAAVLGKCSVCGKALTDPFDAALGTCESCRAKETPLSTAPAAAPRVSSSAASPPAASGNASTGSRPILVDAPKAPPAPAPARAPAMTPSPVRSSGRRSPLPWVALGILLVVGGGAFVAWKLKLIGQPKQTALVVPPELAAKIRVWSLAFPELSGTAAQHLQNAERKMLADRPGEYRGAEIEYEKAAVVANGDATQLASAAAGVVEAYLLGRSESRDPDMEASLQPLLDAASQLAPNLDGVLRARAYALAHQGPNQLDDARRLAQQAADAAPPETKAQALLALGSLYIDSAEQSFDFLNRAIQANPNLQRAYYLRGMAAARIGRYKQALTDFEDRVKRDPNARNAAIEIARIHLAIGDPVGARGELQRLLEQDSHATEAQLILAIIDYQLDHNLRAAENRIAGLIKELPASPTPLQVRALIHGAAIAREAGDLPTAKKRVERALQAQPENTAALYQRVLVALAQKQPAEAQPALDKLLNLQPPNVRYEALAGRVLYAENKPTEAAGHFRAALESSRIDLRAAILGAALAAKASRSNDAYDLMKKAADIDPAIEQRHRGVTDYYESLRSELAGAAGAFEDDTSNGTPITYAGIVQYHRGEQAKADRSFQAALKLEPELATALAYQAQLQLDDPHGNAKKAKELADRGHASELTYVLPMYLGGRAREVLKDTEGARLQYRGVLKQAPGFTSATYRIAVLDRADGNKEAAEELLLKLFHADPDETPARKELFELGY